MTTVRPVAVAAANDGPAATRQGRGSGDLFAGLLDVAAGGRRDDVARRSEPQDTGCVRPRRTGDTLLPGARRTAVADEVGDPVSSPSDAATSTGATTDVQAGSPTGSLTGPQEAPRLHVDEVPTAAPAAPTTDTPAPAPLPGAPGWSPTVPLASPAGATPAPGQLVDAAPLAGQPAPTAPTVSAVLVGGSTPAPLVSPAPTPVVAAVAKPEVGRPTVGQPAVGQPAAAPTPVEAPLEPVDGRPRVEAPGPHVDEVPAAVTTVSGPAVEGAEPVTSAVEDRSSDSGAVPTPGSPEPDTSDAPVAGETVGDRGQGGADQHGTDQHGADQHGGDQHGAGQHDTGQHDTGPHRAGQHRADPERRDAERTAAVGPAPAGETPAGPLPASRATDGPASPSQTTGQPTGQPTGPTTAPAATGGPVAAAPGATGAPGAAAGPAAAPTTSAVTGQVLPELARLVTRGDGTQRVTVKLAPEALGEVRIVLTVRRGEVHVRITGGEAAQAALLQGQSDLHRLLAGAGATSSSVQVGDQTTTLAGNGNGNGNGSDGAPGTSGQPGADVRRDASGQRSGDPDAQHPAGRGDRAAGPTTTRPADSGATPQDLGRRQWSRLDVSV